MEEQEGDEKRGNGDMSYEIWEVIQRKVADGIELQLALQCAPLIAGLKPSNLLKIRKEDFFAMKEIVRNSHISWYLLVESGDKVILLLYDRKSLESYLSQKCVRKMLREAGYQSFSFEGILREFQVRYQKYMETREEFPHEMGLLLGYPVEDVDGFMKHKGEDALCSGYWKVYKDEDRKRKLFEKFEKAKETLIQLLSCGISMGDIVAICRDEIETKMLPINFLVKIPDEQVERKKI